LYEDSLFIGTTYNWTRYPPGVRSVAVNTDGSLGRLDDVGRTGSQGDGSHRRSSLIFGVKYAILSVEELRLIVGGRNGEIGDYYPRWAYLMNNLGSENVRFSLTLIALLHL
jgi:hypothetical protein